MNKFKRFYISNIIMRNFHLFFNYTKQQSLNDNYKKICNDINSLNEKYCKKESYRHLKECEMIRLFILNNYYYDK